MSIDFSDLDNLAKLIPLNIIFIDIARFIKIYFLNKVD